MNNRPLLRILRWPAWGCVILIAVLSMLPAAQMARTGVGGKIEHMVAYAGTAFLIGLTYPAWRWQRIAIGFMCYAAVLELLQLFSVGRHSAMLDWVAGSAGALIGLAVIRVADDVWWRRRRKSMTPSAPRPF